MVFTIGLGKGLAWRYKCGMQQVDSIEVMRLPAVTKERAGGRGEGPRTEPLGTLMLMDAAKGTEKEQMMCMGPRDLGKTMTSFLGT